MRTVETYAAGGGFETQTKCQGLMQIANAFPEHWIDAAVAQRLKSSLSKCACWQYLLNLIGQVKCNVFLELCCE